MHQFTRGLAAVGASVVGVGDITFGDLLRVPLTTISWSRTEVGREAAELLLTPLEEDDDAADIEPRRVVVPPRLIVRESCGGARPR